MKIRLGHVTNSSSSSFMLLIDRKTKSSISSIKELLESENLNTIEELRDYCGWRYDEKNLKVFQSLWDKGYYILQCATGGDSSYNDGNAESLLAEFDIKSKEIWNEDEGLLLTEDVELV